MGAATVIRTPANRTALGAVQGSVPGPRPHVLLLVDGLTGGAERFARLVTLHLDPDRYRRTLCVTRAWDHAEETRARSELEDAGATLLTLGRGGRADLRPWATLVRYLRSEQVDVLHAHKFGSNLWASLLLGARREMVMIAHEHTWSYEGQLPRRLLDRYLISRRAARFVAVSRQDERRMIEIERIDPSRIVIVPVGIPDLAATGHDVRAELGIPSEAPVIVSVGYLRPQKAFEVLLEAASKLRLGHPGVRVLIVGDGEERPRLEALISSLDLGQVVHLLGRRRDVTDVLAAGDVAVCCSDFEGTPQAVLEYMSAARPVVATRVGGLPDLVEQDVTGLLVEPRSPGALAQAIGALLASPDRARELGAKGRERQRSEFTLDATVTRLDALYSEVLGERGLLRAPAASVRRSN